MDRPQLPLNALRAFEVASRHLSLTRAAIELCVTQAALSHQIRGLEDRLGVTLFRRVPRGLVLTEEGTMLAPVLSRVFDEMAGTLDRFSTGHYHETINLGVVGSFATEWLIPNSGECQQLHPSVDLRVQSNNNRIDIASERLDAAIRFGDGSWHGLAATRLMECNLMAVASPQIAEGLQSPEDLLSMSLLRSYRANEWERWFAAHGLPPPQLRGPVFDNSLAIAEMSARSHGVGLLPDALFMPWVQQGRLARLFDADLSSGAYWLTRLHANQETSGQAALREWLVARCAASAAG